MPYYVIEGEDATGKSDQAERLAAYLREQGREVVVAEEPSRHSMVMRVLRRLLKEKKFGLTPKVQVMLFMASRLLTWDEVIEPALERGMNVVASRNWFSTLAYQCTDGVSMRQVKDLARCWLPLKYRCPDGVVILTLTEEVRLARQQGRDADPEREDVASERDAFESQGERYQWRVNKNYEEIAREHGIPMIDVRGTKEEVHLAIREALGV